MQGVQRQTYKTDIQESKELVEKVSIRKHTDCSLIVPTDVLYSDVENFQRGKLKNYYEHSKKYISDTFLLDIIKNGLKLDFNEIPFQHCCTNFLLSKEEMSITNSEIQKLKSKKVIVNTGKRTGDYVSGVFTKSKKDGSHRITLNLKNFNKFICYRYFKMESIHNVLKMLLRYQLIWKMHFTLFTGSASGCTSSKVSKIFCK